MKNSRKRIRFAVGALAALALVAALSATTGAQAPKVPQTIYLVGKGELVEPLPLGSYSLGFMATSTVGVALPQPVLLARALDGFRGLRAVATASTVSETVTVAVGAPGAAPTREIGLMAVMSGYTLDLRGTDTAATPSAKERIFMRTGAIALPEKVTLGPLPEVSKGRRAMVFELVADTFAAAGTSPRAGALPFENLSLAFERPLTNPPALKVTAIQVSRVVDGATPTIFDLFAKRTALGTLSIVGLSQTGTERMFEWRFSQVTVIDYRQQAQTDGTATEQFGLATGMKSFDIIEYNDNKPGPPFTLQLQ